MTAAPISATSGPVTTPMGLAELVDQLEARLVEVPVVVAQRRSPDFVDGAEPVA